MSKKKVFFIQIFMIMIIVAASISVSWLAIFYEIQNHRENMIKAFSEQQYIITSQLSDKIENAINDNIQNKGLSINSSQDKVIDEIIKKETNSKNEYTFFYNVNSILFERNDSNTEKYKDKTVKQVFDLWKYDGGNNLDTVEKLMNEGISGSGELSKNSRDGKEIVTWCFFQVQNQKYIIGMSTLEDYLGEATLFNQHVTRMYAFGGIFTVILFIISIAFCLYIFSQYKKVGKLESDIENKNIQLEGFTTEVKSLKETNMAVSIYDSLTGVYNRNFFYTLIPKMRSELLLPIAVIIAEIHGLKNINYNFEHEKYDEVLVKIADILKSSCDSAAIVSRMEENKLALILVNKGEEAAHSLVEFIREEIQDSLEAYSCSVTFGIAVKKRETEDLIQILEVAENNLDMKRSKRS